VVGLAEDAITGKTRAAEQSKLGREISPHNHFATSSQRHWNTVMVSLTGTLTKTFKGDWRSELKLDTLLFSMQWYINY
jgi:hypothetical protein